MRFVGEDPTLTTKADGLPLGGPPFDAKSSHTVLLLFRGVLLSCLPHEDCLAMQAPDCERQGETRALDLLHSYQILDWLVREYLPAWLDLAGSHRFADWLRNELSEIVDAVSAHDTRRHRISEARQEPENHLPDRLTFQETKFDPDDPFAEWRHLNQVIARQVRAVMRSIGGDVAADLTDDVGVPDADLAAAQRFMAGTPIWSAMRHATREHAVHTQTDSAGSDVNWYRCPECVSWGWEVSDEDADQGEWMLLWDDASALAWEAAGIVGNNLIVQMGSTPATLDPDDMLRAAFAATQTGLQHAIARRYVQLVEG
jgi:hypothetical protein